MKNILHIDASGRQEPSVTRKLTHTLLATISSDTSQVIYRDVSNYLPFVDETMITAYYTPAEQRSDEQNQSIALSNTIVKELVDSNVLILGAPMYNFAAPAGLKAWADLAARVGETFRYTENGPQGLLEGKKAYVVVATGGVKIDSPADFLTPWIRLFLGFIGISDIQIIGAEALNVDETALERSLSEIKKLTTK